MRTTCHGGTACLCGSAAARPVTMRHEATRVAKMLDPMALSLFSKILWISDHISDLTHGRSDGQGIASAGASGRLRARSTFGKRNSCWDGSKVRRSARKALGVVGSSTNGRPGSGATKGDSSATTTEQRSGLPHHGLQFVEEGLVSSGPVGEHFFQHRKNSRIDSSYLVVARAALRRCSE